MVAPIAENRRARFDYVIEETHEAGIVLSGWEIKAIRAGQVQLTDGYVVIRDGELYLIGCRINALRSASTHVSPEADRTKKLLMHKDEIRRLIGKVEQKGYTLFKNYGCVACHQGTGVGGNMFQTFGVMGDYFKTRGDVKGPDLGRFNATKRDADKHVFKVPSLRNVALTAPYFHDGSARTLEEAVDVMFKYQLGRSAPKEDKALIIRFLATLTGETPRNVP